MVVEGFKDELVRIVFLVNESAKRAAMSWEKARQKKKRGGYPRVT